MDSALAEVKTVHECAECGPTEAFIDGFVFKFGKTYCGPCYQALKQAYRQEEADDRRDEA